MPQPFGRDTPGLGQGSVIFALPLQVRGHVYAATLTGAAIRGSVRTGSLGRRRA